MRKQLILVSDMEGASGIFEADAKLLVNGTDEWRVYGRERMTSDVLAVCDAATEFGIDEVFFYDSHFAGNPEPNVLAEKLPKNVKLADTQNRCFDWRRIRGQAELDPFGIITVGQHARNGATHAYFPHTIQSPPIKALWLNGMHIAEIGMAVLSFQGVRYIANIGCQASKEEALELSKKVKHITVKDKQRNWEPSIEETYPIIRNGVLEALENADRAEGVLVSPPYLFKLELCKYFFFEVPDSMPWKGYFKKTEAFWEAPSVEIGFEILELVRRQIKITANDMERLRAEILQGQYDTSE